MQKVYLSTYVRRYVCMYVCIYIYVHILVTNFSSQVESRFATGANTDFMMKSKNRFYDEKQKNAKKVYGNIK